MAGTVSVVGSRNDLAGLARRFLRSQWETGDGGCGLKWWGHEWWAWAGGRWRRMDAERVEDAVKLWLSDDVRVERDSGLHRLMPEAKHVVGVMSYLRALCAEHVRGQPGWLEDDKEDKWPADRVIAFRDRVVVVRRREGEEGWEWVDAGDTSAAWFDSGCVECMWRPDAQCGGWERFLGEVMGGDGGLVRLLQQWFGYCMLSADTSRQRMLMLHGVVRGGKGTIARVLRGLLGEDRYHSVTAKEVVKGFHVREMATSRLVSFEDLNRPSEATVRRTMMELLKLIVGEGSTYADIKHKSGDRNLRIRAKVMVCSNELDCLTDENQGLSAKLMIIPMDVSFLGRENLTLDKELSAEVEGIAAWGVRGAVDLCEHGFVIPERAQERHGEFVLRGNPTLAWIRARCVADPEGWAPTGEMYVDYLAWWAGVSEGGKPMDRPRFCDAVKYHSGLSLRRVRRRVDGVRSWGYEGLRLDAHRG